MSLFTTSCFFNAALTRVLLSRISNNDIHGHEWMEQTIQLCNLVLRWVKLGLRSLILRLFYIRGSVHRNSILIRSNKMQQYAGIYLLQNYSTCFGRQSHPSSGVHKTVTADSGTCHRIWATFIQRGLIIPRWRKVVAQIRDMTCTRGCSYSFMYSWSWVRWTPETCRVILQ